MFRHRLKYSYATTAPSVSQDAEGHFVDTPGTVIDVEIPCLFQFNGAGRMIPSQDGGMRAYDVVVSMPKGYEELPPGRTFRIYEGDKLRYSGTVLLFYSGLMDNKIWA